LTHEKDFNTLIIPKNSAVCYCILFPLEGVAELSLPPHAPELASLDILLSLSLSSWRRGQKKEMTHTNTFPSALSTHAVLLKHFKATEKRKGKEAFPSRVQSLHIW
jgi:hypothetical protein